jgi:hypothetical protein
MLSRKGPSGEIVVREMHEMSTESCIRELALMVQLRA